MSARDGRRRRGLLALAGVLVAVALVYLPALDGGFVWIDHAEIEEGRALARDWEGALALFADDGVTRGYHRPVYGLAHSLDRALWGLDPRGFHATSVLLHLVCTALAFAAVRVHGWSAGWAAAVALLFGLHPLNSAVAGLVHAKADELYLAGVLAAWVLFARSMGAGGGAGGAGEGAGDAVRRHALYGLSLAALLVALWSKENAFLYAPAVLAASFLPWSFAGGLRPARGRLLLHAGAAAAVTALVLLGRSGELGGAAGAPGAALPLVERVETFAGVYVDYWKGLVLAVPPSLSDTVTRATALPAEVRAARLLAALVLVVAQVAAARRVRGTGPWLALLNLSLLPVAQVLPALHFRADRYLYGATLAFAGALVAAARALQGAAVARGVAPAIARRSAALAALALAAVFALRIPPRLAELRDDESLFRTELARVPDYAEGLAQLARALDREGRFDEAAPLWQRAFRVDPARLSYLDRGGALLGAVQNLLARGRVPEALELATAAEQEPLLPRVREELAYDRAVALLRLGRAAEARPLLEAYAADHPDDPSCRYLLGRAALATGDTALARRSLERYLELAPGAPDRAEVEALLAEAGR